MELPRVMSGEQLGVELRPAMLFKLLTLEALGATCAAVFLIETRDVASKSPRLRMWEIPDANSATGSRTVSPLGDLGKRKIEQLLLNQVPICADFGRARDALVEGDRATSARAMKRLTRQELARYRRGANIVARGSGSATPFMDHARDDEVPSLIDHFGIRTAELERHVGHELHVLRLPLPEPTARRYSKSGRGSSGSTSSSPSEG